MKILIPIPDLKVGCAIPTNYGGYACGLPADTGVVLDQGYVSWRCTNHRALVDLERPDGRDNIGHVVTEVAVKVSTNKDRLTPYE